MVSSASRSGGARGDQRGEGPRARRSPTVAWPSSASASDPAEEPAAVEHADPVDAVLGHDPPRLVRRRRRPATTGPSRGSASATVSSAMRRSARSRPRNEATKSLAGVAQQLGRAVVLLEHAADVEDGDAVGELDRLVDVVGDEDDRLAHPALQVEQLVLQAGPHDRVDGAVGLVHQQDRRVGGQRPGHADPLLLPAGELGRVAREQLGIEPDEGDELVDPRLGSEPCPSRAARARWRCCRRWCGAGTARSAG